MDGDLHDDLLKDKLAYEQGHTDEYSAEEIEKKATRKESIEMLENQIKALDNLPKHERFSFVTNSDLYYLLLSILNIFKKGL